jgi:hypothetical protein
MKDDKKVRGQAAFGAHEDQRLKTPFLFSIVSPLPIALGWDVAGIGRHFEAYACALDALSVHPCRVKERAAREKQILIRRFKQEGFAV